ncbi:MAG: prolipoprotein diacylglyceryl transferase [Polyangiaceae bacterium]|jgi:prolipoprotein diacylglyceryl transferase|nr:prolipoprotein diacylglyceryl transferase [Polyangiaceae bacterium]
MEWNIDPVALDLGFFQIRWYGICFMIGLMLGASVLPRALERRGLPKDDAGSLTIWGSVGMIIGAHLVHLAFYEPRSFIDNPIRIIQVGLGLASHGGGLGAIIATALLARKRNVDFHTYVDVVINGAVWVIPFVRLGNFFNSEIYGRVTDVPWGVVFSRHGFVQTRHPSQLYEAAVGFALAGLTVFLEHKRRDKLRPGALFYLVLGLYFTTRFLVEYVKEYQVLSPDVPLTMGQLLSLPFALFFLYMALFSKRHSIWVAPPSPPPASQQAAGSGDPSQELTAEPSATPKPES